MTTLTPSEPTPTEPTRSEAQPSDSEPQPSGAPSSNVLEPRRLILSTVLVSMLLVGGVAALGTWFHRPLLAIADSFVGSLGGPGVALGYFIPDAFTIPLPNDVSSLLGLAGGMTFFEVCAWATLGSLLGGAVGYWVGRLLRTTRWLGRVFERRGGLAQQLLERYGLTAVAVAAITPLPYSIFCWAAGAGKLPFRRFLLVSLLRIVRVAGYLYLIQLGLLGALVNAPV